MRLVHLSILASTLMGGCIIYEEKVVVRGDRGDECCSDDPGQGWDDPAAEPLYWLTPALAAPGETLIVSLQSDQAIDWASVDDLYFYGDVSVCTMSARDDELLVTISVSPESPEGPVDMLIIFAEGEPSYVPAALTISGAGGGEATGDPADGSGGGGSGSGDGGGSGGSGDPSDGSSGDPADGGDDWGCGF